MSCRASASGASGSATSVARVDRSGEARLCGLRIVGGLGGLTQARPRRQFALGSAGEKEKAGSIEQRIEAYKAIAKVVGKDAFPTLWATTQIRCTRRFS